ncbi:hypothetical protein QAD02_011784 [Eretmocerus hayati]|uniref:Uncharacterized protein n=1 Tax=Eretmocerus hayati TaxID=131215 RepID=A0ACC2NXQ6_9HYME|nr:hypothetical protein QAD02_011784 [Eretmocerus hayati]
MFALVLWVGTQEFSVIDADLLKGKENVMAKCGEKFYPVKVLVKSNDEEWLDSLSVTVDGSILPSMDDCTGLELLRKRKIPQKSAELSEKSDDDSSDEDYTSIGKGTSTSDRRRLSGTQAVTTSRDSKSSKKDVEKRPAKLSNNRKNQTSTSQYAKSNVSDGKTSKAREKNESKQQSPLQFSELSEEDVEKLKLILTLVRSMNFNQKVDEPSSSNENEEVKIIKAVKHKRVPLFEGSDVRISEWKLKKLADLYKKKPRDMVRKLMIEILGTDTLQKSSPTGKGGWEPIPQNVYDDVEMFVREHTEKKFRITHEEYMRCLTVQCATLRYPKKSSERGKTKKKSVKKKSSCSNTDESSGTEESNDDSESGEEDNDGSIFNESKISPKRLRRVRKESCTIPKKEHLEKKKKKRRLFSDSEDELSDKPVEIQANCVKTRGNVNRVVTRGEQRKREGEIDQQNLEREKKNEDNDSKLSNSRDEKSESKVDELLDESHIEFDGSDQNFENDEITENNENVEMQKLTSKSSKDNSENTAALANSTPEEDAGDSADLVNCEPEVPVSQVTGSHENSLDSVENGKTDEDALTQQDDEGEPKILTRILQEMARRQSEFTRRIESLEKELEEKTIQENIENCHVNIPRISKRSLEMRKRGKSKDVVEQPQKKSRR